MGLPGSPGSQHVDEKRAEVLHKVAAPGGKAAAVAPSHSVAR